VSSSPPSPSLSATREQIWAENDLWLVRVVHGGFCAGVVIVVGNDGVASTMRCAPILNRWFGNRDSRIGLRALKRAGATLEYLKLP
jgi:hypothetical protein